MNLHLNIWVPDTGWPEAYDPGIQPTPKKEANQIFAMHVDSVNVQSIGNNTDILGDFNGDGQGDILWRHTGGAFYLWQMDGLTVKESDTSRPSIPRGR